MKDINIKLLKEAEKEDLQEAIALFESLEETHKNHKTLSKKDLIVRVLEDYSINKFSINEISDRYGVSTSLIHKLLQDFYLFYFDDKKLQELSFVDPSSHFGVLYSFFNSVSALSKEITFNTIISKKLREKISTLLTEKGIDGVLENRKLLNAWKDSIRRFEVLLKLSVDQTNTYLNLIEKVLDRQREVAFVKAMYEILSELDPQTAIKLQERLYQDEYARALIEANSLEDFVALIVNTTSVRNRIKELNEKNTLDVEYAEEEWQFFNYQRH